MREELTTSLFREIKLTPDLINVIENRLTFSLQPLKEPAWRLFDLNINFSAEFGKVRLKITAPVRALRNIFSDTYHKVGELDNKELKKLMRSEQFQLKKRLYYFLLGKIRKGMTEVESNIMSELSKDKEIQRYLLLRLGKGGKNVEVRKR